MTDSVMPLIGGPIALILAWSIMALAINIFEYTSKCSFCRKGKRRWQTKNTNIDVSICNNCHRKDNYTIKTSNGYDVYNEQLNLIAFVNLSEIYVEEGN